MSPLFGGRERPRRGLPIGRLVIALIIGGIAVFTYLRSSAFNPVTGRTQHIAMTVDQEIALGLRAAPEMAQQFGGLDGDDAAQQRVDRLGQLLTQHVPEGSATYPFEFHLLADHETVNAFALPGGQVFITRALYDRMRTDGQLAGVLAHEIGHVVGRHSAEQLAKVQLAQGLSGAAAVATYDPRDPGSMSAGMVAQMVAQLATLKFSRDHELESDRLAVRFMGLAGFDPNALIRVMEVLAESHEGRAPPEFLSTHPDPGNRVERIREAISAEFPGGVPEHLRP